MSAYVVDDKTINTVVSFLSLKADADRSYYPNRPLIDLGYDLANKDDCERLANDMFALNVRAVDARYGEGEAKEFRALDFQWAFTLPGTRISILKAIECWHYQCCEGDVPETSDLYKAFGEIAKRIAVQIVHDSPEYQKSRWG